LVSGTDFFSSTNSLHQQPNAMKTIAAFIFAQILCLPLYAQENPDTGSRFYADIQAQYFYVGRADLGPYVVSWDTGFDSAVSTTVAYPRSPLSYATIGLGAGVRLR
jgi:hypothetical protein